MDRNLALEMVRVTEAAALAAARYLGKGDPPGADRAAVSAMEIAMKSVKMKGEVIIGENPDIENSILFPGCYVGAGGEMKVEIALDALDCRDSLADGLPNAISAIAIGPEDTFIDYPSPLMKMIAVGPEAVDVIDLNDSVFDNLVRIAEAKREYVEDLAVAVLNRKRHTHLIEELRQTGARIVILDEGDLPAAIATGIPGVGIDAVMGTGNSAQGVIAAAALRCLGGGIQGQFVPPDSIKPERKDKFSIRHKSDTFFSGGRGKGAEDSNSHGEVTDAGVFEKIFKISDIIRGDNVMFAATGVSLSPFLKGTIFRPGGALTHSMVLRSKSGTIRFLRTEHFFDKTPDYS